MLHSKNRHKHIKACWSNIVGWTFLFQWIFLYACTLRDGLLSASDSAPLIYPCFCFCLGRTLLLVGDGGFMEDPTTHD